MRNLSPLTGLPGNIRIQEEIERQVREAREFAVLYCDLQLQGLQRPEGVRAGRPVDPVDGPNHPGRGGRPRRGTGFVGHVGGDDFVVVVRPEAAEDVAKGICEAFESAKIEFYEPDDLERGFVRIEDRKGVMQDIPLVAISIGIASSARRPFAHYGEAVAVATEMKQFAKREAGLVLRRRPAYPLDRRTGRAFPSESRVYSAGELVSGAGCNSPPAVRVRDPTAASRGWIRCDSGTDRDSRDGRRRAHGSPRAARLATVVRVSHPPPRAGGGGTMTVIEERHMRRALALAERGMGRVSPNPMVGAVVVHGATVLGKAGTRVPARPTRRLWPRRRGRQRAWGHRGLYPRAVQPLRSHAAVHAGPHRSRRPPRRRRGDRPEPRCGRTGHRRAPGCRHRRRGRCPRPKP